MITVCGPRAEAFARRLTGIDDAVIADAEMTGAAFVHAMRKREAGRAFYGMVLLPDLRSKIILNNLSGAAANIVDLDLRRDIIAQFCAGTLEIAGQRKASDLWAAEETLLAQVIGEFFGICDELLVRSQAEYLRLVPLLKRPRPCEVVVVEATLPAFERRTPAQPSVVVWLPDRTSLQSELYVLALSDFLGELTFVTSDGAPLPRYPGRFMRPDEDIAEVLAGACCVLCGDPDDPGAAIAFARRGFGVVAPLTSGAHEFVRDIVSFDIGDFPGIMMCVQVALARPASIRAVPTPRPAPARPALPAGELPLVSVVLVTYNRREDVARALTCLHAQTYPNVEIVVVNDAGENVDDVIARFPNARPYNIPVNGGVLKAIRAGLNEASGDYIQVLADDDWLEPDHVEALVGAMLRTGAAIAHSNTVIRQQKLVPGAEPRTTGFNTIVFNESTTPSGALIATPVAGHSIIFRRDILAEIGTWREDCILADQEFQLRAAGRYPIVYVDRITAEWRARGSDNLSTGTDSTAALRQIYEELHPVTGRPILQRKRQIALGNVGTRTKGEFAFPPTLLVDEP